MRAWAVIGLLGCSATAEPAEAPRWLTDPAAAKAEAARTGKPVFLVFR